MRSRGLTALGVAVVLALGGWQGAAAIAGPRIVIPPHSIGWNKLTTGLQERLRKGQLSAQPGPAGKDGAPGATGSPGAPGQPGASATGKVFTYDPSGGKGNPLTFTGEDGSSLESIGPLTFQAYCEAEGEDIMKSRLEVTSDEDGVIINGEDLNQGFTRKLQELTVAGGGTKEEFLPVLRVTNEQGTFAAQAVLSVLVSVGNGCHFWGSLIEDS